MNARAARSAGFTLLELAVVLLVMSLLLASTLGPLGARHENAQRRRTAEGLEAAREALYGHALARGRLPCPDCRDAADCPALADSARNDGAEDVDARGCLARRAGRPFGNLPWTTLGVDGRDAWDHPYTYAVSEPFADLADGQGCGALPAPGVSFELCTAGELLVRDDTVPGRSLPLGSGLPALVLSHGANAVFGQAEDPQAGPLRPASPAERHNTDGDATWLQNAYAGQDFDDQLVWLSVPVLMQRMVAAGRLP